MTLTWAGAADLPQVPFGRLFRRLDRPVPEGAEIVTAYTDGQVTLRSKRAKIGYHEAADLSGFKGVEVGDFVVHGLDILRGSVGIADSSGAITAVCAVCEPVVDLDVRYVAHVVRVQAQSGFTRALARGIREGGADFRRWGTLAELPIPMPPIEYQRASCDYLDRETARIDTLIEEQQRLIVMLVERRASLISNVTGWGATRRKEWPCTRLSWLFQATGSGTTPANEEIIYGVEADVAWVTTGELRESLILGTARGVSFEVAERYSALKVHPAGSLLIAMYGATIGRMALLGIEAASNQACCALIGPVGADPEFVQYSLMAARGWLLLEASGGGQPNINQDKIRSFRIPTPPLDEQRRIAAYLNEQTTKIDALIAETERFIELARERRSALITAAVTGQIDVRAVA